MGMIRPGLTPEQMERFWSCIDKRGDGCWIFRLKSECFSIDKYRKATPTRIIIDEVLKKPGWKVKKRICGNVKCCAPEHQLLEEAVHETGS